MSSLAIRKPDFESSAVALLGTSRQAEMRSTIRLLVWDSVRAQTGDWLSDLSVLCENTDLVLLQQSAGCVQSEQYFSGNDSHGWIMADGDEHSQTGDLAGLSTGCIAQVQHLELQCSGHNESAVNTKKLLLESHYALAESDAALMVLNMQVVDVTDVTTTRDQLEQLSNSLAEHAGPVVLAGDFNHWDATHLELLQKQVTKSGLVEASLTRRSKEPGAHEQLDRVFFRGLSLSSLEALQHVQSSEHSPIKATFVVEQV